MEVRRWFLALEGGGEVCVAVFGGVSAGASKLIPEGHGMVWAVFFHVNEEGQPVADVAEGFTGAVGDNVLSNSYQGFNLIVVAVLPHFCRLSQRLEEVVYQEVIEFAIVIPHQSGPSCMMLVDVGCA